MSATAIQLEGHRAGGAEDVRLSVRRLFFLRRLWRACRLAGFFIAGALALLCLIGSVDYVWPLARAVRAGLLVTMLLAVSGALIYAVWMLVRGARLSEMARVIERAAGVGENALVTFAEAFENEAALGARPYMLARLEAQARRSLSGIDERVVAPRRAAARGASLLLLSLLLIFALRLAAPNSFAGEARRVLFLTRDDVSGRLSKGGANSVHEKNAIALESFRVRVVPPAYSGLGAEEVAGDAPVRALVGSEIEVELTASGQFEHAVVSFGGVANQMRASGEGRYNGSFIAQASGAFETRIIASDEEPVPAPIVRAVEVYADTVPEAHITEPARDQLLRGVPASPVSVRWDARDDLGLADVSLKYIKSRGEGDAAQFTSGSLALGNIERASAREWRGATTLDLARLGLQPGDTLVYWLEARDRNPNSNNMGRSATLAIAITAPEPVKLNLSDLGPNEIGRFLLSQRMIIIHTEKLHAERARLKREDLMRRAQDIAAEQRDFKNSFNDYIKIEGEGEEHIEPPAESVEKKDASEVEERAREAADERTGTHKHGIPEPPTGTPNNVRDMIYAIRAMWDAEDALSLADTAKALQYEREALTRLKRAQLAVRYVPPIVARSKPIDLKRRYAGELQEIKTRLEKLARRGASKETVSLRNALADAYAALGDLQATLDVPATARASAVARAREKARAAADSLSTVGGDHAATIAEATGQLRIVETELARLDMSGRADEYAARLGKPLALLTQAAGNLFAIAEATTRSTSSETNTLLPADDARAAEYFRKLSNAR